MENDPLFLLLWEDLLGLYFAWLPQLVHDDAGTHKSDEPVSKSIVKDCAGLPTLTLPVHSRSSSWSVKLTPPRFWNDAGILAMGLIAAPFENA